MRLCIVLTKNKFTNLPVTNALLALMCFQASRFDTRIANDGAIVLLKDQDRSKWNKQLIGMGQFYLERSAIERDITEYHLEAALASCHALAGSFETTNWTQIIQLYDMLLQVRPNPIIELNRAIAVGYHESADAGVNELLKLQKLKDNHYYHTALGDFYDMLDRKDDAVRSYASAADLTESKKELQLLYKKISRLA
jgi:RNA polymerase sigma-70 factor (ECF subfamily)